MKRLLFAAAAVFGLCGAGSLRAADTKIAVVDAERDEMLKKFEKMRKDFEDVRAESENKALSDEGRALKRKDAERKIEEMRDFDEQVRQNAGLRQKQIKDRKTRMRQRIVDDIKTVIRDYAAKNKYTLVLDAGPVMAAFGVVVYSVDGMDITGDITKILAETRKPTLDAAATNAPPKRAAEKAEAK